MSSETYSDTEDSLSEGEIYSSEEDYPRRRRRRRRRGKRSRRDRRSESEEEEVPDQTSPSTSDPSPPEPPKVQLCTVHGNDLHPSSCSACKHCSHMLRKNVVGELVME